MAGHACATHTERERRSFSNPNEGNQHANSLLLPFYLFLQMFTCDGEENVWAAKRTISISMLSVRFSRKSVERKRQSEREGENEWCTKRSVSSLCGNFVANICSQHVTPFFAWRISIGASVCVAAWMEHVLLGCWTNVQANRLQCKYDNNTAKPNFRFKMLAKFFVTLLSTLFVPSLMACIFAAYALEHLTTKKKKFRFFVFRLCFPTFPSSSFCCCCFHSSFVTFDPLHKF